MAYVVPLPGSYARIDACSGNGIAVTNEAMQHVSDVENGNPAYTVYEVTDETKRNLKPGVVPTFEKQIGGAGDWIAISASEILEIQYPGARLVLITALGSTDLVRMATGQYMAIKQMYGCATTKFSDKTVMRERTCIGDTAKMQHPTISEFSVDTEVFYVGIYARLVVELAGDNNNIVLEHMDGGVAGNSINFEIVNPGGDGSLAVSVAGTTITVNPARTGGTITSTAEDVIQALNLNPSVARLKVVAKSPAGDNGSGVVTAYSSTPLAGGLDPEDYSAKKGGILGITIYGKQSTDLRWEGYCYIEDLGTDLGGAEELVKQSIKFAGHGKLYYRKR